MGFDFEGIYTDVVVNKQIEYIVEEGRAVTITFEPVDGAIRIVETLEVEDANAAEMQRQGGRAFSAGLPSTLNQRKG